MTEEAELPFGDDTPKTTAPVGFDPGSSGLEDFIEDMEIKPEGSRKTLAKPWMQFHKFHLVRTIKEVRELIDACLAHGNCALDLETEGFDNRIEYDARGNPYTRHKIVGYCIGLQGEGYYIPVRHRWEKDYDPKGPNVDDVVGTEREIKRLCVASQPEIDPEVAKYDPLAGKPLAPPKVVIKFWHAKFDQEFLYPITGIDWWHPDSFEDGMLAAYVIYTDGDHGLKENALTQLDPIVDPKTGEKYYYEMIKIQALFHKGSKRKDVMFYNLSPSMEGDGWNTVLYGGSDGICTDLLCNKLVPKANEAKYGGWYRLEKQVVQAVRILERQRIKVDKGEISKLLHEAQEELESYEQNIIRTAAQLGFENFNPGSATQLANFLFEPKGLNLKPKPEKTANGQYKTDGDTLESLIESIEDAPEVLDWIIKHRQISKITGTYLKSLSENTDERDQLRLNFKQTGAATGRFTAPKGAADHGFAGVPIQGIPAKNDPKKPKVAHSLRRVFVARPGYVLAKVDYASQELRIAASVSGERKWIDEYVKEIQTGDVADLHFMTAQAFYPGLKHSDPDFKLKRGQGKCVHPDTLVDTVSGYRALKDIAPFAETADTFLDCSGQSLDGNPVVATYNGGIKPLYHVVTRKGVVTCTSEHRFMCENGELVRAGDLQKGMLLSAEVLPTMPKAGGSDSYRAKLWKGVPSALYSLGAEEAYFAGLFLGDGSTSASGCRLIHGEVTTLDAFSSPYQQWQDSLFKTCTALGLEPSRESTSLYLGSRVVVKYLSALDLIVDRPDTVNGKMKNLRVPAWVLEGGQAKFLPFLGGLIDTDGSVSHQAKIIEFTTKDFVFAGQIAALAQACDLRLSVEATYNKTYERHYARIKFTVDSSWRLRQYIRHEGKVARLGKPVGLSMMPLGNDVLAVLPAGDGLCLDVTMGTEDHLYRTNGLLTHNTANFALVYGGGVGAVRRATGCDDVEGARLLKAFHESVPNFSKWVAGQHVLVKKNLGVKTAFGRFIAIPDANITADELMANYAAREEAARLKSEATGKKYLPKPLPDKKQAWRDAKGIRAACERKSTNFPIQGSGADILKISLIMLIKECHLRGWLKNGDDSVRLVMTVHDEVVFEILEERVAEALPVLKKIMEYPAVLKNWLVPLIAEPDLGSSWNAKLHFMSMVKGDKDHPVPDYLVGKTIDLNPPLMVMARPKKDGATAPSNHPAPAAAPVLLGATPATTGESKAGGEEAAGVTGASEDVEIGETPVETQVAAKDTGPVDLVPNAPLQPGRHFKKYAVYKIGKQHVSRWTLNGVVRALTTAYELTEVVEKLDEMIPVQIESCFGDLLMSYKEGVLAHPDTLSQELRTLNITNGAYEIFDAI